MNVLAYAPQMAAFGGMERHVCELACALAARDHRVSLLTTSNSLGAPLRTRLASEGVGLRELSRSRGQAGRLRKSWWLLREVMRRKATRWDVIYTNGQSALARLVWLARAPHTRIVHHHHTAGDAAERATWSGGFRVVLERAPELVACSEATREELGRALRRDDVRFLPYLTGAPLEATAIRDRVPPARRPLNFGFTGRLVAEKGIDRICALSQLDSLADIVWHIHGAGPKYPPAFFEAFPNIVYHGPYTSGPNQAEILLNLDAVVLFSTHNEGMPLSLIEAMAAGLPWVATDRGGTREMAVSPQNAIVVPAEASLPEFERAVQDMAHRLRAGLTSRTVQRRVYDDTFSPATVSTLWCDFLEAHRPQLVS